MNTRLSPRKYEQKKEEVKKCKLCQDEYHLAHECPSRCKRKHSTPRPAHVPIQCYQRCALCHSVKIHDEVNCPQRCDAHKHSYRPNLVHLATECPIICLRCKKPGHMQHSEICPFFGHCQLCQQEDHVVENCPWRCGVHSEIVHLAEDCSVVCNLCERKGHREGSSLCAYSHRGKNDRSLASVGWAVKMVKKAKTITSTAA